jgi:3-ketosteroid 9alpha-monooxygenase subunit B
VARLPRDDHGERPDQLPLPGHPEVTPTSFLLQWGAIVRRPPGLSDAQASRVAAKFADFVGLGFQQDVEIWRHKTRIDNPLLCAEDGPVYQVRRWYEQFYCDVADVAPDMVARFEFEIDTTRAGVAALTQEYYQVPVAEVVRETGDGCSLVLDVPPALSGTFGYRPGQFVTVRVPSDLCGSVPRCYSLSSSPHAGERPAITVKRTSGGYASNWILERVAAGTVLDLLPPAGTFCPGSLEGDFLLFAAGSGITPVMSILKSALAAGRGRVVLVYANRDERSVIFGPRCASSPPRPAAGWWWCTGWIRCLACLRRRRSRPWPGRTFRSTRSSAGRTRTWRRSGRRWPAWACRARGCTWSGSCRWPRTPSRRPRRRVPGIAARLSVTLDGETTMLAWPAGTRMLDVLIEAGLDAPYSCRQGICDACACQLTGGKVDMAPRRGARGRRHRRRLRPGLPGRVPDPRGQHQLLSIASTPGCGLAAPAPRAPAIPDIPDISLTDLAPGPSRIVPTAPSAGC